MKEGDLVRHRKAHYRKSDQLGILIEPEIIFDRGSGPLSMKIEHKGKLLDFTMPTGGEPNTRAGWLVLVDNSVEWWDTRAIIPEQDTTPLG